MKKWAVLGLALLFGAALVGAPSPAAAELKVGVSGYVKLDVQYSDKIFFLSDGPGSTPLDTDKVGDNSELQIDARQTRFRIRATDEVAGVKMASTVEADFFTVDGNALKNHSRHPRLRHAFARADVPGGFFILAGQYWGLLFNEDVAGTSIVDFNGPAGQMAHRQPQLRLGTRFPAGAGDLILEGNIEQLATRNLGAAGVDESQGRGQTSPLFNGRVSWLGKMFKASAAGAVGKATVILADGSDTDDTVSAFALNAEANLAPITVYAHYQFVSGLGGLANNDFAQQVNLTNNELEAIDSNGFYVGAKLDLTKDTSINAVYGYAKADKASTGSDLEKMSSIYLNIFHKFWQRWMAGLEYRRFDVETFAGVEGDVNIVHGALYFFF